MLTQFHLNAHTHLAQYWRKALLDEIKARCHGVVRTARQKNATGLIAEQQRWQDRLQHKHAASCAANLKSISPRLNRGRCKRKCGRIELRPVDLRVADLCGGLNANQMLAHQPRLRPLRTDMMNVKRLACNH